MAIYTKWEDAVKQCNAFFGTECTEFGKMTEIYHQYRLVAKSYTNFGEWLVDYQFDVLYTKTDGTRVMIAPSKADARSTA